MTRSGAARRRVARARESRASSPPALPVAVGADRRRALPDKEGPSASPRRASARRSTLAAASRTSRVDAVTPLEGSEEVAEGARRFRRAPLPGRSRGATPASASCGPSSGARRAISRNATCRWKDSWTSLRRRDAWPGWTRLQDERLGEILAVGELEQPRPEVVVLALEKRRVVTKAVVVEQLAVDEHGRMEERGAEERVPANRQSARAGCGASSRAVPSPSRSRMPPPRTARPAPPPIRLSCDSSRPGERDVVRVEPRDVAPGRLVEATVERRRKPELLVVA